ncbi:peptide/nickel transport system substrate-binding protein [Methylophilus rhizosphaerae]|uniref:Peptide/nickel transport system substrate-binding protein n=2 Tax=Methylophilus rhizosphaerae TaxID=492660 RepID=A0A1G9AVN8_9PROT|nr:peptide/nickel transport system substrate-binding protein [Methylophilus rhizosphaerae]
MMKDSEILLFAKNKKLPMVQRHFLILFLSSLLGACGSENPEQKTSLLNAPYPTQTGGTLMGAMPSDPSSLIFMVAGESASSAITANLFNSLLTYDQNLDLAGELAESWQVSPDQKTLTFHLKPGLVWADGHPLTSEDVFFTWQAIIDEKTRSPYASDYQLVTKAETPDKLTFVVHYDEAFSPSLDSWAGLQILPKHKLAGQDLHTTSFAQKPLGSHYYQLKEWRHGEYIKLEKNPKSVLGPANIDHLVERIIPDPGAQFLELMADNIDSLSMDPITYARIIPSRPELQAWLNQYESLGNSYTYLGFNLKRQPFKDIRIRKAINLAIDKQEIIDGVYLGLGEQIASPYKPGTRWSNPELKPYPFDPQQARSLLAEAGYKDSDGDGILEKDGKKLSFEVLTNHGNKEREKTAVIIQRRLKEVGIEIRIRTIEWASFITRFIKTGDFDAVVLGWQLGLEPDQFGIWHSSQQKPGQFNFIGYNNPKVDQLLERGRREFDPDKRMHIYHQFAEVLYEDSPIVYLSAGYNLTAIHKRVRGIMDPVPPAGVGYDSQKWYLPMPLRRTQIQAE